MAVSSSSVPAVETGVSSRVGRRRFTVEYKTWVVQEAARLRGTGDVGALLRREGLFSSQLTMWRKQYAAGVRQALSQKRGPKATTHVAASDVRELQRENATLRAQLARAELVIDIQKKLSSLMATPSTATPGAPS